MVSNNMPVWSNYFLDFEFHPFILVFTVFTNNITPNNYKLLGFGVKILAERKWIITSFCALATSIWVDFWIFSDQAQLLDPESAASKEPRSGLVA